MNLNEGALPHILSTEDPLWPIQQAFLEVAVYSGETDQKKLFRLARRSYFVIRRKFPPNRILKLFREWAIIHAKQNASPEIQWLIRYGIAEDEGPEALAKFKAENPSAMLGKVV